MKKCYKCGEVKPISEYHKDKNEKSGVNGACKTCMVIYAKNYYKANPEKRTTYTKNRIRSHPYRTWAGVTRGKHKTGGCIIHISLDELESLAKTATCCAYCGIELNWSQGNKGSMKSNSPTLDRMDNTKIITKENVQILCSRCNATKFDRSHEEFVNFCINFLKRCGIA